MEPSKAGQLFESVSLHPLCQSGEMGKNHVEFLALLQSLPKRAGRLADTASCAAIVQSYWKQQILAIRQDRANGEYVHYETRSKSSVQRKRFELACCAHCHRVPAQPEATREEWEPVWDSGFIWEPDHPTQPPFVKWPTRYLSRTPQDGMASRTSQSIRSRTPGCRKRFLYEQ
jgi:hypothetical protein